MLGSWTPFNQEVSRVVQQQSATKFLPVIPQPPDYSVCKHFLDTMRSLAKDLELNHVFVLSDEQVYARFWKVIWAHGDHYKNIILLLGGFHQLLVRMKSISKRHRSKGYPEWFADAHSLSIGAAQKAFSGGHYNKGVAMMKELFDALVQYETEIITENYQAIDQDLLESLKLLRWNPSFESLDRIVGMEAFKTLFSKLTDASEDTENQMTVSFLKDVSSLLMLVSAARERDLERRLAAERIQLKSLFAFDHPNYARFNAYQHVFLMDLKVSNPEAFLDLITRGMGPSLTGNKFSTIHGDLYNEYFSRETKSSAGPFCGGYSLNVQCMNDYVNTHHIFVALRTAMETKLLLKTSSVHKEATMAGKKKHQEKVEVLKKKLKGYEYSFDGKARNIATGEQLDENIVTNLLNAEETGNQRFLEFVKKRIVGKSEEVFWAPIKRLNPTGTEKRTVMKVISVLKEDRQAFGKLVSDQIDSKVVFEYPLTTYPLSIAEPNGALRSGNKAALRNFIIEEAEAKTEMIPKKARWIYDSMPILRAQKREDTYEEYFSKIATRLVQTDATFVEVVNESYEEGSIKEMTRKKRGEGSRIHVKGLDQKMVRDAKWHDRFFNNTQNKRDLIAMWSEYLKLNAERFRRPVVCSEAERTWISNSYYKKKQKI